MKKHLNLIAASAVLALAACTNDGLVNDNIDLGTSNDNRISFSMLSENMSKAVDPNRAEQKGHYEFGVFAYLDGSALTETATDYVMQNYLVAYSNGTDDLYKDLAPTSSTYVADENGDNQIPTVNANGQSSWFYEGLAPVEAASPNPAKYVAPSKPDLTQILKYWTVGTPTHFVAYMPYRPQTSDPSPAANATINATTLTMKGLTSFYTDAQEQISGVQEASSLTAVDATKRLLNYNEALYAYKTMTAQKAGTPDVELNFKHMNAKIQLAFYEKIAGYSVKLLDLVPKVSPSGSVINGATFADADKAAYAGIALTPATAEQAAAQNQPEATNLPKYISAGNMTVSDYKLATPSIAVATDDKTETNANLCFKKPANDGYAGSENTVLDETTPTILPTTYYALPQEAGTRGYTLHVSFEMIPEDGSAHLKVYDARVYIPATECAWEAGKAYKYIFKITNKANGTTNPNEVDPYNPTTPWVDPVDPRVPEDPALQPIVFDGVTITDYDADDAHQPDEKIITDDTTIDPKTEWPSFTLTTTKYYYNIAKSLVDNADVKKLVPDTDPAYAFYDLSGLSFDVNEKNNGVIAKNSDTEVANFPAVEQERPATNGDVTFADEINTDDLKAAALEWAKTNTYVSTVYIYTANGVATKYVVKPHIDKVAAPEGHKADTYKVTSTSGSYTGYGYVILSVVTP